MVREETAALRNFDGALCLLGVSFTSVLLDPQKVRLRGNSGNLRCGPFWPQYAAQAAGNESDGRLLRLMLPQVFELQSGLAPPRS